VVRLRPQGPESLSDLLERNAVSLAGTRKLRDDNALAHSFQRSSGSGAERANGWVDRRPS
jgi:hypothetical protein